MEMATITPGYHECPRCLTRDVYFAKRAVGQVGNLIDLPEGIANPKIGFDIEKDVAICRACGERANWIPEKTEYSDSEKKERYAKSQRVQGKIAAPIFFLCVMFGIYAGNEMSKVGEDPILYYAFSFAGVSALIWIILRNRKFK
jgi:hypothetical protein